MFSCAAAVVGAITKQAELIHFGTNIAIGTFGHAAHSEIKELRQQKGVGNVESLASSQKQD